MKLEQVKLILNQHGMTAIKIFKQEGYRLVPHTYNADNLAGTPLDNRRSHTDPLCAREEPYTLKELKSVAANLQQPLTSRDSIEVWRSRESG